MNLRGNNIRGAIWVVGAAAVATIMSAGVHELAGAIHSAQTVFVRGVVGSFLIFLIAIAQTGFRFRTDRLKLHLLRGVIGVVAINFGFYSIMILPLATVTALFFTTPLFVTALSIPLLGERVGLRRASASVLGFVGALIVIGYSARTVQHSLVCTDLRFYGIRTDTDSGQETFDYRTSRHNRAVFCDHSWSRQFSACDAGLGDTHGSGVDFAGHGCGDVFTQKLHGC